MSSNLGSTVLLEYLVTRLRRVDMENDVLRRTISEKDDLLELAALEIESLRGKEAIPA